VILAQAQIPLFDWDWVGRNLDTIWARTVEHLGLTGFALLAGLLISSLLSLAAIYRPTVYRAITSVTGVIYTIPSLAVFAVVAPVFGISTAYGRFAVAEVALVGYTLLILVRNIVTGIRSVPDGVREAAAGMGYSGRQMLMRVEVPLAVPVIVAGVRIATVTVVGLVTVTSLLGMGGLGFFILDGIRRSIIFPTEIIVGVALSVVLAAVLDIVMLLIGRVLTPWARTGGGR
jgi:osmoprotectant transport system permease protein